MANLNDKLVDYKSLKENTKLTLGEALAYDKGLAGGYNGDFPLTVATKGNIYRVPTTNKFYMCITDYNGSNLTAPNANFEELSVWANRDKLENLNKIYFDENIYKATQYIPNWGKYKFHSVLFVASVKSDTVTDIQITLFGTEKLNHNNNFSRSGGLALIIKNAGEIFVGDSNFIENSYITEIRMWN